MCDKCNWDNTLDRIIDLLETGKADWAEDTLSGIHDWIGEHRHVTEGQRQAVENIGAKVEGEYR